MSHMSRLDARIPRLQYFAVYNGTVYQIGCAAWRRFTKTRLFPHSTKTPAQLARGWL